MELVERYIYATTRHLTESQRKDVADELRGLIEDMLDERGSRSKKAIRDVLITLGNPENLALQYKGSKQYLIGPSLYGIYLRALKLTFAIGLPIGATIVMIDQILRQPDSIIGFFLALAGGAVAISIQILFWVTLVFFVLERTNVTEKELTKDHPWTPDMLPEVSAKRQIPAAEAIGEAVWYTFIIALPFIAPFLIGAVVDSQRTPLFNPQFPTEWVAVIVALGVIGLIKALLKLHFYNWTIRSASLNAVFAITCAAVFVILPFSTQLINPAFTALLDTHITTANLAEVTKGINWTIGITAAVMAGVYLYDAFKAFQLARKTERKN
jgi:hypothetical protein